MIGVGAFLINAAAGSTADRLDAERLLLAADLRDRSPRGRFNRHSDLTGLREGGMRLALALLGLASALLLLAAPAMAASAPVHPWDSPIIITPTAPQPGVGRQSNTTPTISATFADTAGTIFVSEVFVTVDSVNVTGLDSLIVTTRGFSYYPPSILKLSNGNHTVVVSVSDTAHNSAHYSWGFVVNTNATSSNPLVTLNPRTLILDVAIGAGVVGGGVGGYYLLSAEPASSPSEVLRYPSVKKHYLVVCAPLSSPSSSS